MKQRHNSPMLIVVRALAAASLSALALGCNARFEGERSAESNAAGAAPADEREEVLAPIESADLQIRESFPVQYALRIASGLPNGCARFSRIETKRGDAVVDVMVWNTKPTDPAAACTLDYRIVENTVELGTDFESGREYEVRVNQEPRTSFTAQ